MKHTTKILTLLALPILGLLLSACARMGTRQVDENHTQRYELDESGRTNAIVNETRKTSTKASGASLIQASSTFEGLDAGQDGFKQGLKIKKSAQKSDGMAEFVESARALRDIGAMMYGFPPAQSAPPPSAAPPSAPPAGKKWVLVPKDEPSQPQLETDTE